MLNIRHLIFRYSLFAVLATGTNFTCQAIVLSLFATPYGLGISLLSGTVIGFVVKYLLDKRFIFFDDFQSARYETIKVIIYGLTAIVTTSVFWLLELGAWALWHTPMAKYLGGTIGLCIGYMAKYMLDRRFVFYGIS